MAPRGSRRLVEKQHSDLGRLSILPPEVQLVLAGFIPNRDIKSLRLTCKQASKTFLPRFDRVFISPNRRALDIFKAIAEDERFRHQVREIAWDDCRFYAWNTYDMNRWGDYCRYSDSVRTLETFTNELQKYLDGLESFGNPPDDDPDVPWLSPHEDKDNRWGTCTTCNPVDYEASFKRYEKLFREQDAIIREEEDRVVFRLGLAAFPRLRTVTITNGVYQLNDKCKTPLAVDILPGIVIPERWAWPSGFSANFPSHPWLQVSKIYRGFTVATEELANGTHQIENFIVRDEDERGCSGIGQQLLKPRNRTLESFQALVARPGLKRLELPIFSARFGRHGGLESRYHDWDFLRNGILRNTLSQASDLEHFCFSVSGRFAHDTNWLTYGNADCTPLLSFLPVSCWPNLRHLALYQLFVELEDLGRLLRELPETVETIHLGDINVLDLFDRDLIFGAICEMDLCQKRAKPPKILFTGLEVGTHPQRYAWPRETFDTIVQELPAHFTGRVDLGNTLLNTLDSRKARDDAGAEREFVYAFIP